MPTLHAWVNQRWIDNYLTINYLKKIGNPARLFKELHRWKFFGGSQCPFTFLTLFLKEAIVSERLLSLLSLDHITGGIYLILCLPWLIVYILGIKK